VVELDPKAVDAHFQIGVLSQEDHQPDQAVKAFKSAVALQPENTEFWLSLGAIHHARDELRDAISAFRQVIALQPGNAYGHCNLGAALRELSDPESFQEAISECRQAVALSPELLEAHVNLANALKAANQFEEAEAEYLRAIELKPNCAEAYSNLGAMLHELRQVDRAIAVLRQALAINPGLAAAHNTLGNTFRERGMLDEGLAECQLSASMEPNVSGTYNCLGNILKDQASLDESIAAFRKSISFDVPFKSGFHSNLLMTLSYHPLIDPQAIADEHFAWDRAYAEPLRNRIKPLSNDRNPDRRLRIGYISPDFREHVVALYLMPLLANHDHGEFEIYCYANVPVPDHVTERMRGYADHWRSIFDRPSNAETAALIREDRIDILVELAGHSADNRLLVLAHKPAPIQVNYLGYASTTGMQAMDYRITDALADPPGMTESHHSERLVRLPRCNWCYEPPAKAADAVCEPPSLEPHPIVFGCFPNLTKVNQPLVDLWGRIVNSVPGSKLVLKASALKNQSVHRRFEGMMRAGGIGPDQVEFLASMPMEQHLKHFAKIDIFLDTFPYHGTTTTCETLWMGVPVVTLAGRSHVARVGVSLLSTIGLPELIAASPDEYVRIAVDLANDLPRLAQIRSSLRQRMIQSQLRDGPGLARAIEQAYRKMWREWCGSPTSAAGIQDASVE
jgi:predicted O-linked N-acetylglucosamine transferase (SPINDLY family)